jgi:hypothetical protein
MKNPIHGIDVEHALALLGLVLMLIVAWLANRGYSAHATVAGRVASGLARRAIDGIAVIGWLADRLPQPAVTTGGVR